MRIKLMQTVVYWGDPTPDGFGGFTYEDPVEVDARWEERQEMFTTATGQQMLSKAIVYLEQDVDINGYLMLGTLEDLESSQLPGIQPGAYMIQAFEKVPNVKATFFLRKAWL